MSEEPSPEKKLSPHPEPLPEEIEYERRKKSEADRSDFKLGCVLSLPWLFFIGAAVGSHGGPLLAGAIIFGLPIFLMFYPSMRKVGSGLLVGVLIACLLIFMIFFILCGGQNGF